MSGKLPHSPNFSFLSGKDAHLRRLAMQAESFCFREPDIALTRMRQLLEAFAAELSPASRSKDEAPDLHRAIRDLEASGLVSREIAASFHTVRKLANEAVHTGSARQSDSLHALKLTRAVAIWFHRLENPQFKPTSFAAPPTPVEASDELRQELEELRQRLASEQSSRQSAESQAQDLAEAKVVSDAEIARAYQEMEAALALASETEAKLQLAHEKFLRENLGAGRATSETRKAVTTAATKASAQFLTDLDEAATREIIDTQLRDAGWEADSQLLRYSKGARPIKGRNRVIAEWPTASGPVDYAFFIGLELVAVGEAKKFKKDLPSVLGQAKRYARDIYPKEFPLHATGPWGEFKVPFVYVTNGRPYLRQIQEKSGIHFHDLRKSTNHPHALDGWPSPEGLLAALAANIAAADLSLAETPIDLPGLRIYQVKAIHSVEEAIAAGQRELLLAMATGTGKTRTAISLIYRLIKSKRFRRILFLVDRTELGKQAFENGFDQIKLEQLQTFTEIYNVSQLGDTKVDPETRVHIATVQSMVRRVMLTSDEPPPPVDQYDCVIIDECHRGYNLDRDMAEHELAFRSEADFIAKYRRVVDHFHAVKIGLTATPALHTAEIFGRPVFTYSYREAVTDNFLCDHEPPIRIVTELTASGIHWKKGEELRTYDPGTGTVDLTLAPDEVIKEVDSFNNEVITEPFNRTVCKELVPHLDPDTPGKTLVFCARDSHADLFIRVLKEEMDAHWGPQPDGMIAKITGSAVQADDKIIKKFKNEAHPKIAVTVDLLTTGIDVPEITRLVFVRRVKSRILYEQMIGRATRLCENLFGDGHDKEIFEIFDAVDLYAILEDFSTMKPVVANPTATLSQQLDWIKASSGDARQRFTEELVVKIRRLRKRIVKPPPDLSTRFARLTPARLFETLGGSPEAILQFFETHPQLLDWLQGLRDEAGPGRRLLISDHEDKVREVSRGYGAGREKPDDYLQRFNSWIEENRNKNAALLAVLTRPSDLSRADLRSLILAMSDAGFMETHIREAWREAKHQDCPARLVGYIRSQALGSPLIPFEQRVDAAVSRVLSTTSFQWTQNQRRWLERIAKQIKKEGVVDHDSLQAGAFASAGGFGTINKSFSGRLPELLETLHSEIWNDAA